MKKIKASKFEIKLDCCLLIIMLLDFYLLGIGANIPAKMPNMPAKMLTVKQLEIKQLRYS